MSDLVPPAVCNVQIELISLFSRRVRLGSHSAAAFPSNSMALIVQFQIHSSPLRRKRSWES